MVPNETKVVLILLLSFLFPEGAESYFPIDRAAKEAFLLEHEQSVTKDGHRCRIRRVKPDR